MVERTDALTRTIGRRYQVTGELGRGGMGIVWRAWDQVIGREVAIKQLHVPDGVPPAERAVFEERVLREARAAGRLSDPAVVTVFDVLSEAGGTFIVMELVLAGTLAEVVGECGPMPPEQVVELARRLLSALEAAHAAGIVHRDVKPSNIMISDSGVKLADFGIAQTLDDTRLTTSGSIIGSPSFMAPERIQGADATPASDLWSLGATLFFAAEGWLPFDRQTTAATLHAVLSETPRMTRTQGPLGSLIMGLLIADPRARFTPAQARALLAAGPGPTATAQVPAGPGAVRSRFPARAKDLGRGPLIAAAVVLFVAGLLLGRFALVPGAPAAEEATLSYGPGGDLETFAPSKSDPCAFGRPSSGSTVPEGKIRRCSEPHDLEIYATGDPFGSGSTNDISYPGEAELARFGEGMCAAYFASDKIVLPGKDAALRYGALVPSERSWELKRQTAMDDDSDSDAGSQAVHCYLRTTDGVQLTTSVATG
ncbi:serine/threonine-protein kinase [Saccharopolyspora sp. NFXS83]|uniref:serine/threonine-protein kinase n=1 Tax=Saccharopolyspora sp. NFXS83 TaxID=2993560 RepID=UPI00224A9FAE|nr:serine/threonine-protein kinase [Saccharopolyspora sp. NFXS83]MCX2732928.1 serine/threonine-protein kinase [Saccharopolyspora sp. NFXS83]